MSLSTRIRFYSRRIPEYWYLLIYDWLYIIYSLALAQNRTNFVTPNCALVWGNYYQPPLPPSMQGQNHCIQPVIINMVNGMHVHSLTKPTSSVELLMVYKSEYRTLGALPTQQESYLEWLILYP